MPKIMTRKSANALQNFSLIAAAKAAGLTIYREDFVINYAEMDQGITEREDQLVERSAKSFLQRAKELLEQIESAEDLEKMDPAALDLSDRLHEFLLSFVKRIWEYGQLTAEEDLQRMGIEENSEIRSFASGVQSVIDEDLITKDAYEWYDLYTRRLAKKAETDVFQYMQPKILEHIENGTTGKPLADELAADFARYGVVRTEIIARTESTKAFNWGRRYRFDASQAIAGYRYSAIMDERTSKICRGLHGSSWEIGDADLNAYTPPNHYRCRSVIVPIHKYRDFTFQPPADDWMDQMDLDPKERDLLERFQDPSWYPLAAQVAQAGQTATLTGASQAAAAQAAPVTDDPSAAAGDYISDQDIEEMITKSHDVAIDYIQELHDVNIKRGISPSHPAMKGWIQTIDDIKNGDYDGKMITADFNSRAKNMLKIQEFQRDGNIFLATKGKVSKKDKQLMMEEINQIKNDPLFAGVKIQLESFTKSRRNVAYYRASDDLMGYTVRARDGKETLYHEIGHRIHNQSRLYDSKWESTLRQKGINITPDQWDEWTQLVETYWDNKRTQVGSDLLPADMYRRFDYPINAKHYYSKGTKANFQKEMFAEVTSVYLEQDPDWVDKVKRTYPDLLEFMEGVHKYGYIETD